MTGCAAEKLHISGPANQRQPQLRLSSLPLSYIECAAEHRCASVLLLVSLPGMKIEYIPRGPLVVVVAWRGCRLADGGGWHRETGKN